MKPTEQIRYYVQKTFPAVYDDSLSYYELIGKVIAQLNDVIENNNELIELYQLLKEQYEYIMGEGLQNAVDSKIDVMFEAGLFDDLLNGLYQPKPTTSNTVYGVDAGGGHEDTADHNITAVGYHSLANVVNTTKNSEGLGAYTLEKQKYSKYNIAIGYNSMKNVEGDPNDDSVGSRNVGVGSHSLMFMETGRGNTAIGRNSLQTGVNQLNNTAIGLGTMNGYAPLDLDDETIINLTPHQGENNTAVGVNVMPMVNGDFNTSVGASSSNNMKKGYENTVVGYMAARSIESNTSYWGNRLLLTNFDGSFVNDATNGLVVNGTPNDQFRVDEVIEVRYNDVTISNVTITESKPNYIKMAYQPSLPSNGSLTINRFQWQAEYLWKGQTIELSTHYGEIGVGSYLYTQIGQHEASWYEVTNIADGKIFVKTNIVAPDGGEVGDAAIQLVDTKTQETPLARNTFIGSKSGYNVANSQNNTAVGVLSLANVNGGYNTAIGGYALAELESGNKNTGVGYNAGRFVYNENGSSQILSSASNITALGYNSRVSGNNQVQLGDGTCNVYTYNAIQQRSDERDKSDIRDTILGLDFIEKLRPVDYKMNFRDFADDPEYKKGERFHHGLIAQEVHEVCKSLGVDFGGYQDHSINGGADVKTISYIEIIAPLIKAVQELSEKVRVLEEK